jgi:hypothetical protein
VNPDALLYVLGRPLWYAPTGRPITSRQAAFLSVIPRNVGDTYLHTAVGAVRISTIFLVNDHSHSMTGPPVLWETMVFGGPLDCHQWRWRSFDAARDGHTAAVAAVRAILASRGLTVYSQRDRPMAPVCKPTDARTFRDHLVLAYGRRKLGRLHVRYRHHVRQQQRAAALSPIAAAIAARRARVSRLHRAYGARHRRTKRS